MRRVLAASLAACFAAAALVSAPAVTLAQQAPIVVAQAVVPTPRKPKPRVVKPGIVPGIVVSLPKPDDEKRKPRVPDRLKPKVTEPRPPGKPPKTPPRVARPDNDDRHPDRPRRAASAPSRSQRALPRVPVASQSHSRQILVLIGQAEPDTVETELASRHGLERIDAQPLPVLDMRAALFRIRDRRPEAQVISAVAADSRVRNVQLNYRYRHESGPSGTAERLPQYANRKVDLPSAHQLAQGRNISVAVIDSAIDMDHPDLKGAVARSFDAAGGEDKAADFHGTAVAGIIRARGTLEGVSPEASLLAVRAFLVPKKGDLPETTTFVLLKAIDWAVRNDAKVLNLSFAGPRDPAVHEIIKAAVQRRVVAVAAAGNGGPSASPAFPAAYPEVIAVTALDERDRLYKHANRGRYIAVSAPGVDILAPVEDGKHSYLSGTSFATAFVSGIAALMLERDPTLTPEAIGRLISASAQDLGPKGRDDQFGAGLVNAFLSLQVMTTNSAEKR